MASAQPSHEIKTGSTATFTLDENPTTGFRWQFYFEPPGKMVLVDSRFEMGGEAEDIGSGGKLHVTFRAVEVGPAQVQMKLQKPWLKTSEAIEQKILDFMVV